jgi:hypothetical protein
LLPQGLKALKRVAKEVGVDLRGAHTHQAKPFVTDLLPAVKVDRCWDAFSVDSSDTPLQGSA